MKINSMFDVFQNLTERLANLWRMSRTIGIIANLLRFYQPDRKFWEFNLYGLRATLVGQLGLKFNTQLKVGSDHGVHLEINPSPNEIASPSSVHLTWSTWREGMRFIDGRRVLRIQHPWIAFRKKKNYAPSSFAKGTLVFYPHSAPGLEFEPFNDEEYLRKLMGLPNAFHPISFCFHYHDYFGSARKSLAARGFRCVTVGNSLHPNYVDRFYKLLMGFKFATSPSIGSQLFYSHELGIKYFLYGHEPGESREIMLAPVPQDAELVDSIENAFSFENLFDDDTQKNLLVSNALSLELDNELILGNKEIRLLLGLRY